MRYLLCLGLLVWASPARAQLPFPLTIHGHPQCVRYVADDITPGPGQCHVQTLSGQGHWAANVANTPCHVHIDDGLPRYAEVPATLSVRMNVQLFHCAGYLSQLWSSLGFFVLDANGGWVDRMHLVGDPNGLVVFPGTYYFNIAQSDGDPLRQAPAHGWFGDRLDARVQLDEGTTIDREQIEPFFSMRDPSQPEAPIDCDGCGPLVRAQNGVQSAFDPINVWGAAIVQFRSMLPLLPIAPGTLWDPQAQMFGYGTVSGLMETREQWIDRDLHTGIPGRMAASLLLDANELGAGSHKVAFQLMDVVPPSGLPPSFAANEMAAVLEVFPVTVSGAAPPPPPPPPPPPSSPWKTLFVDPNPPTKWLGQCIDTTHTECWPTNMLAVCVTGANPSCAWTPVIVP